MDNFEWTYGYQMSFGLYSVDFVDPKRTRRQRLSAVWYRKCIDANAIVDDLAKDEQLASHL